MRGNLEDAANLKQILSVLLSSVLQANAEVAASHETAIWNIADRTNEGLGTIMTTVSAAIASLAAMGEQMVRF